MKKEDRKKGGLKPGLGLFVDRALELFSISGLTDKLAQLAVCQKTFCNRQIFITIWTNTF